MLLKQFTTLIFNIMGWKIEGGVPADIKKCIMVAAPHTSHSDYIYAMAAFYKMKLPVKYTIKQDWVNKFFVGKLMINSGAIGINHAQSNNMVDTIATLINTTNEIAMVIQPEGTRSLVKVWKTGFYQAAMKAQVPLVLSYLDYKRKVAATGPNFMPSGNYKMDMDILKDFYKNVTPKHPERFCLDIYTPDLQE